MVSLLIFDEERELTAVRQRHLGADERREAEPGGGAVQPRRAVDAVLIHERDGGLLEPGGLLGKVLRQRRRLEEAEGAPSMQLDVHRPRPS